MKVAEGGNARLREVCLRKKVRTCFDRSYEAVHEAERWQSALDLWQARQVSRLAAPQQSQSAIGLCLGVALRDNENHLKVYGDAI
jgi:hypothetical protein